MGAAFIKEVGLLGVGARRRGRVPAGLGLGRRRPPGLLEGDEARGGGPARLGFGPVGRWRFFFNNFAETKINPRKINKNLKMPKQIFTV